MSLHGVKFAHIRTTVQSYRSHKADNISIYIYMLVPSEFRTKFKQEQKLHPLPHPTNPPVSVLVAGK